MLLEIYILFQILAIIGVLMIFHTDTVLVSATTMVISGILAVGAWQLNVGLDFIWDAATKSYITQDIIINTPYLASFNILIFGIALMYFFHDLFAIIKNESKHISNPKPQGGQQQYEK